MERGEMLRLFEAHREAEAARDIDAILETFVDDCFLDTVPLGLRAQGRDAVRAAYEQQFFSSFPDLAPDDEGMAVGDDVIAVWGTLRGTSRGDWLGVPPGGGSFEVPFTNVVPFGIERMDLLTLAGTVEAPSEHPLAQAIAFYAQREGAGTLPVVRVCRVVVRSIKRGAEYSNGQLTGANHVPSNRP